MSSCSLLRFSSCFRSSRRSFTVSAVDAPGLSSSSGGDGAAARGFAPPYPPPYPYWPTGSDALRSSLAPTPPRAAGASPPSLDGR